MDSTPTPGYVTDCVIAIYLILRVFITEQTGYRTDNTQFTGFPDDVLMGFCNWNFYAARVNIYCLANISKKKVQG